MVKIILFINSICDKWKLSAILPESEETKKKAQNSVSLHGATGLA